LEGAGPDLGSAGEFPARPKDENPTVAIPGDRDLQTPVCFFLASIAAIVETSSVRRGFNS
jgi:hypothetical protein